MKSVILQIEEYLVQKENAVFLNLTANQKESLKNRIIQNEYMDTLLTESQHLPQYAHLSKMDILHAIPIPKLLREVNMDKITMDISCYKMPDGCIIEIERCSGYFATCDDKSDWHQKICSLFSI